jgi:hypothetical protein
VSDLILDVSGGTISWSATASATAYDVVKGSLDTLASSHGDFAAALLDCLVNDTAISSAADPATPAVGNGFFYLVRAIEACGLSGTYDEGGSQAASRDAAIASAPPACP